MILLRGGDLTITNIRIWKRCRIMAGIGIRLVLPLLAILKISSLHTVWSHDGSVRIMVLLVAIIGVWRVRRSHSGWLMVRGILRVMMLFIQGMRSAVIWIPSSFPETIIADGICMGVSNSPVHMRVIVIRVCAGVTNRRIRNRGVLWVEERKNGSFLTRLVKSLHVRRCRCWRRQRRKKGDEGMKARVTRGERNQKDTTMPNKSDPKHNRDSATCLIYYKVYLTYSFA